MNLATSQMHGKSFENSVKAANGIFSYSAADRKRGPNDIFDIGAQDDKSLNIPTSIKSTGSGSVALADARRFWNSFNHAPYRLLIGSFRQDGDIKVFETIHEFILRARYKGPLLGNVTALAINHFHDGLKTFPLGQHAKARAWAKEYKTSLEHQMGTVSLNYKIDSKTQRRLQCSVSLDSLRKTIDDDDYFAHTQRFGSMVLPHSIISKRRSG